MPQVRIAVFVGSLRKASFNRKLATALVDLGHSDFSFNLIEIGDLPLYNQDDDANPSVAVSRLKTELSSAHGLLFVTAEYNRSIPGVLKNAIDHASRPHGQNAWSGKPAGIIGASLSAIGTAMAQQHLRNVLSGLNVPTMANPEAFIQIKDGLFDPDGGFGPASKAFMQSWMDQYVAWVRRITAEMPA